MHRRLGTSVPSPSYLLGGLLARVGRFVGRIYLRCTEVSINDGIYGVQVGAYRGKVKMICTDSEGVSYQFVVGLVEIQRQQGLTGLKELGLTGLEEVRLTFKSGVLNNDDPLFSAFAAAAVQYCSNLTTFELTE